MTRKDLIKDKEVLHFCLFLIPVLWVSAVLCWMSDRLLCGFWTRLGFPYLHGFWHVLIFLASYTGVVLFAYFDVKNNHPYEQPVIK